MLQARKPEDRNPADGERDRQQGDRRRGGLVIDGSPEILVVPR